MLTAYHLQAIWDSQIKRAYHASRLINDVYKGSLFILRVLTLSVKTDQSGGNPGAVAGLQKQELSFTAAKP